MYKHRPPNQLLWERHQARWAHYLPAGYNFDPAQLDTASAATGWRRDHDAIDLPAEAPGPAAAAGSFAAAQQVLREYAFPPPDLLVGIYDPDAPLPGRLMLLRGRFLGFTFWFGVRVGPVLDAPSLPSAQGPEQVWGYGYRTLQGHFERGQIDFTVRKNLHTGAVQFHLDAVSQLGTIRNPLYWLGFRLFGRMLQRRFAHESLARMRWLVLETIAHSQTKAGALG